MRVSIILSALAASVLATPAAPFASPAGVKHDVSLGGIVSPGASQLTSALANAFGAMTSINGAIAAIRSTPNPLNVPGDLFGDTSLLLKNSALEIVSLDDALSNAVNGNGIDLSSQANVIPMSIQIVTGQVQQLISDLTGIGGLIPNSAEIAGVQNAAGDLLNTLNHLQSSN